MFPEPSFCQTWTSYTVIGFPDPAPRMRYRWRLSMPDHGDRSFFLHVIRADGIGLPSKKNWAYPCSVSVAGTQRNPYRCGWDQFTPAGRYVGGKFAAASSPDF